MEMSLASTWKFLMGDFIGFEFDLCIFDVSDANSSGLLSVLLGYRFDRLWMCCLD